MALDGIVVASLAKELQENFTNARLSKIAQPEKDELLLTMKGSNGQKRLLLSASASLPLIYISDKNKPSPMTAPNFCMLLRKHVANGRITAITQPGMERIIVFEIEHLDDLGDLRHKKLIIELMGKHSNIIFCDENDYNVRINFRNGKWGELEVSSEEYLNLHMAATCLHYGQEAFEGLKAFRGKDGKVRIFRLEENAARLQSTCQGILMAELPTERFKEAILKVVKLNERFIPPYETGASLYIRPLLIGTSAQVGVHPADEYMFVVFVTPVGPYFKGGFSTNPYVIIREFDRAAPHGTGIYKVGGNYAASLRANKKAHDLGYSCEFYLDAKEKKYIDECGAANFFGIKDNTYITPKSTSILPSITNKSLMQLAEDMGIKVERRPIPEEELATFEEAGACGTAAVISPIERIDDLENGKSYVISKDGKPGPICTKLYNKLRGIQYGDEPDTHGWVTIVE